MGRFDVLLNPSKPTPPQPVAVPTQKEETETKPASLPASQQASKSANQQADKVASQQASKSLRKFTSYLPPETLKGLKRIAFETDRNDYEVLEEAVNQYLERTRK